MANSGQLARHNQLRPHAESNALLASLEREPRMDGSIRSAMNVFFDPKESSVFLLTFIRIAMEYISNWVDIYS
jgi:hypothetical protein